MFLIYKIFRVRRRHYKTSNEKRKKVSKITTFQGQNTKKILSFFYAIDFYFRLTHWLVTNSDYCIKKIINYFGFIR